MVHKFSTTKSDRLLGQERGLRLKEETKCRRILKVACFVPLLLMLGLAQSTLPVLAQEQQESFSANEVFTEVEKALDNEKALSPETRKAFQNLLQTLRSILLEKAETPAPGAESSSGEDVQETQEAEKEAKVIVSDLTKQLKLSGLAYLRYSYDLEDSNANEFDIDRIYLTLDWQLWDKGKVIYTLEGGDIRDSDGHFDVTTKAFFLEVRDLLYPSTYLWVGQADLPWVAYEEGLWGYRFQGTVFPDRMGYLTSTDLGVGFGGDIPRGYGSWQVNVVNGEGWTSNEIGKHKDVHARLTLRPFGAKENALKHLFVTGFASLGAYDDVPSGPDDRNRWIAQAGYRIPNRWTLVGEYFGAEDPASKMAEKFPTLALRAGQESDAQGLSIFGTLNAGLFKDSDFARKWELIGRWDHLDPDRDIGGNDVNLWIAGVSYRWNKNIRVLLNYEDVEHEDVSLADRKRIMLQGELIF